MKKWLGITLVLALGSAAVFYYYSISRQPKISSLESLVPDDALYYVYAYNPAEKIKNISSSSFFRQLSASSVYEKSIKPQIEKLRAKVPFLADFTQRDTALAVFSLGGEKISAAESGIGDFLLLTRVDNKKHVRVKKAIADFYLLLTTKDKGAHKKYKGISITSYTLPALAMSVHAALISDVMIVCNSKLYIEKSIDLFRDKEHHGSLLTASDFQNATSKIKKDALCWGYSNTKRYYQEILHHYASNRLGSQQSKEKSIESFAAMKPMVELMDTFGGQAFYIDYAEARAGFVFKSYALLNKNAGEAGLLEGIISDKGVDPRVNSLVPRAPILYYAGSQNFPASWIFLKKFYSSFQEMLRAEMKNDPRYQGHTGQLENMSFEAVLKTVESFLGVNIENDIVSLLGNNFGMVLVDLKESNIRQGVSGLEPVAEHSVGAAMVLPQFYIFCEVKDSVKTQAVLTQALEHLLDTANAFVQQIEKAQAQQAHEQAVQGVQTQKPLLALKSDDYGGVSIYSIDIPGFPIEELKVNYCVVDTYVIFSLSPDVTKRAIDVYKHTLGSFDSNLYFETVKATLGESYSYMLYFDVTRLLDNLRLIKSFRQWKNSLTPNTRVDFSKEDIDGLLGIASNIKALTMAYTLSEGKFLESSGYIEIEGL